MAILFPVLWVRSFDFVHKRLGAVKWRKVQRLSYILYAMFFIHSVCLNIGRLPGGGRGHGAHGGDMTLVAVVGIVSTCLVFGSCLIFSLRKARKERKRL
jgi:DMSO/TMAO reductase YedYZ heme-binding membrane subunit